jgi:S-adenosylmethionine synthetase
MARHIAKNLVASCAMDKCEVQLAYAIGVPDPVSILVDDFGAGRVDLEKARKAVREVFPLKPKEMIDYLQLRRPIFQKTAAYGHFGRNDPDFAWEKTNRIDDVKTALGL